VNHIQVQKINQFRKFSSEFQDETQISEFEVTERPFVLKELLYPQSDDAIIKEINACSSLKDFSKFTSESAVKVAKKEHVCQLILVLSNHASDLGQQLEPIMTRVDELLPEMTANELTSCYLYLNKLGANLRHPTMEKMTDAISLMMRESDDFNLKCLTRFTYVLSSEKGLYSSMLAVSTIPMISKNLDACQTAEDLHLITASINNISQVVSVSLLDDFKSKVEDLLDRELINETTAKCIFRIVNFLNYPHWSYRNTVLIRRLLLELESSIETLETKNLVTINRAFQSQLESARLVPMIVKRAQHLLKDTPSVELLALAALNVTPDQRMKTAEMARHYLSTYQIKSTDSGEVLQTLFKIVRLLKISDINLCDTYWTKALNEIYGTRVNAMTYRLSRHIQKYMFFNNNLGGTYRHLEFEHAMTEMLLAELKVTMIPKDFAMFAAFIIAYGDGTNSQEIPQSIINKIVQIHEQFTIKDCLILSRGLQIMSDLRMRRQISSELEMQIEFVNHLLSKCAKRHMKSKNLHLTEMNSIIRAYNGRKGENF
jgi:hypothetical protein